MKPQVTDWYAKDGKCHTECPGWSTDSFDQHYCTVMDRGTEVGLACVPAKIVSPSMKPMSSAVRKTMQRQLKDAIQELNKLLGRITSLERTLHEDACLRMRLPNNGRRRR